MSGDFEEYILNADSDFEDSSDSSSETGSESDFGDVDEEEVLQLIDRWDLPFTPNIDAFQNQETLNPEFEASNSGTRLEILRKFVTDEMISKIIEESDRYANQIKIVNPRAFLNWKPFTISEFWQFMAVLITMGINKKPALRDYWITDPVLTTPFYSKVMSRGRFEDILKSLHLVDTSSVPVGNTDRFIKLGTFMTDILRNFRNAINPGEYLCLDESLLAFKGRLSFRQYNPKKRARFGIKLFVLVDCATQFVLDILPYQGKSTKIRDRSWIADMGFGGAAVLTMLWNYFGKCHKVVLDNWFNSPKLATTLKNAGTYILGTVQKRRKEVPKCTRMKKKLPVGGVETFSNGELLIERWIDRREVLMLNSFMSHEMTASIGRNPANTRQKPSSVLLYNDKMGAVDNADKVVKQYETVRKSYKWYKKIFFRLFDLAAYNTFIVWNQLPLHVRVPYKVYLRTLVQEILEIFPVSKVPRGRPTTNLPEDRLAGRHFPRRVIKNNKTSKSDCVYCKRLGKRKQTQFQCKSCNVRLCIQGENSCFEEYHSRPLLPSQKNGNRSQTSQRLESQNVLSQIENFSGSLFSQQVLSESNSQSFSLFDARS